MPEWLTRRIGPLPAWGYAALGVGIFVVYRMRKSSSSSTTPGASTNVTATTPNIPTESVTTPSGFSYTGPAGGLESLIPTGALSATNGSTSGNGTATNPQFIPLTAGQAYNLTQTQPSGSTVYYQSAPGIFSSIPLAAFNPTSNYGPAYLQAPSGYQAPTGGPQPVSGSIGGAGTP